MSELRVYPGAGSVRFAVHVQSRASTTRVAGIHGDALRVRLTAPPVDGAANAALVDVLAAAFAVARRAVRIVSGEASRSKMVEIDGVTEDAVRRLASGG